MDQIHELMWRPHTIAQLKPAAVGQLEQRGASFDDSVDEPGARWAAFVLDDGDEIVVRHRLSVDRNAPVDVQSSWQEERTPAEVLSLLLAEAGIPDDAIMWVARDW